MTENALTRLERELIGVLKQEYSFYQSLYILLDKQRDLLKYDKDESLLDLYAEIERCKKRINASEEKIEGIKNRDPRMFKVAAISPEVKRLVTSIITLVKKNVTLVESNEEYLKDRHQRIRQELAELKNSRKILQYIRDIEPISPQFVDGRK
ncbi:flagellar protein FlgN [bacterium]|nr:flagellar protein FlgN [bacterium]MCB2201590.1 flagellar protein FlgN [bacterium]